MEQYERMASGFGKKKTTKNPESEGRWNRKKKDDYIFH
jgi:hypothetical protein